MIHYPDTDCEIHCDVRTEEPVCLICLIEDRDRHRELEDYSNMQAAQIRKKNNKIEQLQARVKELELERKQLASKIHYPDCWDTAVYPTLPDALQEIGCNPDCCTKQPQGGEDE